VASRSTRFVALVDRLRHEHPEIADPVLAIEAGRIRVDGAIITNPRALVRRAGSLSIVAAKGLRGTVKLAAALAAFDVDPGGRVAADIGASTGGFTTALLEAGARRVYAIDAGHGQLLGRLRQDSRVVNLERTNLGSLAALTVPEPVDLVVVDLSYLALSDAVPQLEVLTFGPGAPMIALVKPMYELGLAAAPAATSVRASAVAHARAGIESGPWVVTGSLRSPVRGARGAIEYFLCARRSREADPRPVA
jgi:23S rRNA (cytidine1920-2'-O)/16S rRNA (cytidine1409-2'-O)-methyltransferase